MSSEDLATQFNEMFIKDFYKKFSYFFIHLEAIHKLNPKACHSGTLFPVNWAPS